LGRAPGRSNFGRPLVDMSGFDPRTELCGIVASLHTPFARDDAVDEASLELEGKVGSSPWASGQPRRAGEGSAAGP
jgi:hypothetical protein